MIVTVTDQLRAYIHNYLAPGDPLETAFRFAEAFAVEVADVQAARDELVAEGLLRRGESQYVVTNTLSCDDTSDAEVER